MKTLFATLALTAIAALVSACGDNVVSNLCDGYVDATTKAAAFPDEAAAAKAKEHLKQAKESADKKDDAGCKTHVKAAQDALKL